MCGITGFWQKDVFEHGDALRARLCLMTDSIANRGPDSAGYWFSEDEKVAFGHRRLSIVDVSEAGHQPMLSPSNRFIMIFNGQVYNAATLRQDLTLKGFTFRGHSDTEVILAAFEAWGVEASLKRFIGMFAIALYDTQEKLLYLIRDRIGVKPLYYTLTNGVLLFGSQVKTFLRHPRFEPQINREALAEYLTYNVLPGGMSIYQGVQQVQPGTFLCFNQDFSFKTHTYWSLLDSYEEAQKNPFQGSDEEAISQGESLIQEAVGFRMVSDVPLGAFLSGGIDSSLVVALMQKQSSQPVKTFTIGFHEDSFNEAKYAKEVAKHLGTDHHELYLTAKDALDVIPKLPEFYDEPFADSSQIPTCLVSHFARQHVTVALSGDGGDEFFAGYTRYLFTEKILKLITPLPLPLRRMMAVMLQKLAKPSLTKPFEKILGQTHLFDKLQKASDLLKLEKPFDVYHQILCGWFLKEARDLTGFYPTSHHRYKDFFEKYNMLSAMQICDSMGYLTDDIMTKVDRASMAVSLEAREPLLDHSVISFAYSLPPSMKIREGKGKWLLRQILKRHVPENLFERPKQGFGIPLHNWLRHELKEWAEDLLSETMLKKSGFGNTTLIHQKWQEHKNGKRNWQAQLWGVLMYQAWSDAKK